MAAVYKSIGTYVSSIDNITVDVPAGVVAGDLLIIAVFSANQTVTAPAGWQTYAPASVGISVAGAPDVTIAITLLYKIAGLTETSVVIADTGNVTGGVMLAISGASTTTPFHAAATANNIGAVDNNFSLPAVPITGTDKLVLYFVAPNRDTNSNSFFSNWTAGLTEIFDQTTSTATGTGLGIAVRTAAADSTSVTAATVRAGSSVLAVFSTVAINVPLELAATTTISAQITGILTDRITFDSVATASLTASSELTTSIELAGITNVTLADTAQLFTSTPISGTINVDLNTFASSLLLRPQLAGTAIISTSSTIINTYEYVPSPLLYYTKHSNSSYYAGSKLTLVYSPNRDTVLTSPIRAPTLLSLP
jgi:hypothetical protein